MHQVELSWNWQKGHFLQIQRVIPRILFIRKLLEAPRARRALLPEAASGRQSLDQMHRRRLQPRLAFPTMIYELLNLSGTKLDSGRNLPIFWWRERERVEQLSKPIPVWWKTTICLCSADLRNNLSIFCGILCGIVCGIVWYCVWNCVWYCVVLCVELFVVLCVELYLSLFRSLTYQFGHRLTAIC